jgi:hypothetical protein
MLTNVNSLAVWWSFYSRAPKLGVITVCKRDLAGDHLVLILGSSAVRSPPHRRGGRWWKGWRSSRYSSHGGCALGAELKMFMVRTWVIYSESSQFCPPPSIGSDLPIYIELGQVHGGFGSLVYGLCASESWRALQRCLWTLALSWSRRSPKGVRLLYSYALTIRLCWLGPASTRYTF